MRASGVLLPIFSLPGKYGIGCFSKEAYKFVDYLKSAGQKYWQILPLGPTSYGDSPYQSFSTFAGNPYYISLERLIEKGLLTEEECASCDFGKDDTSIDYSKLYEERFKVLRKAYERSGINDIPAFHEFLKENEFWIDDYAVFMAVKQFFQGERFDTWPEDIRKHWGYSIDYYHEKLYFEIEFYKFLQYEFYIEWMELKAYANQNGIQIIGDIPIYVAYDSADVWAHPELFQMDQDGKPYAVAGCPPDGFSATGQLWGNPLYDWVFQRNTGFNWWVRRIDKCRNLYDVVRIDHFRGFDEYYSVPAGDKDASRGHWEMGPGIDFFNTIKWALGDVQIIAEDLGYMTESVRTLVRNTGYPNMKVIEFAFDSRDSSGPIEYLPHNYGKNSVVYTGTHDNETIRGWLDSVLPEEVQMVRDYVNDQTGDKDELAKKLVRLALASTADFCIIPIQDYLGLGNEARINQPSTLGKNWKWRISEKQMTKKLAEEIKKLSTIYARV